MNWKMVTLRVVLTVGGFLAGVLIMNYLMG